MPASPTSDDDAVDPLIRKAAAWSWRLLVIAGVAAVLLWLVAKLQVIIVPVADSSKAYHGRVVRISNIAHDRNGETIIPVEITIEDYDEFLKPKYNVDVKITTD